MKLPSLGWRYAALCTILLALPVAAACGTAEGNATSESNQTEADDEDGLEILFPKMYSAFDGEHTFKIPAKVDGVKKITWTADPADAVDLEKQADGSVMITIKKAGDVKITAKSGSLKGTAPLKITEATPEDWEVGEARYNDGIVFGGGRGEGGGGRGDGGGGRGPRGDGGARGDWKPDPKAACTNCHARGGKGGKGDVAHTPMQTAGYSDDELIKIFSEGTKPDGVPMRVTKDAAAWKKIHNWAMEDNEKKGMIVYLRSLEPKSQEPGVDFGGRGGGRGGRDGGGGGKGDGKGTEKPAEDPK